jgi:hypothetical protein
MGEIKDILQFFGSQLNRFMKIQIVFDIFIGITNI